MKLGKLHYVERAPHSGGSRKWFAEHLFLLVPAPSSDDQKMLEYVKAGTGARLSGLVVHDDAMRGVRLRSGARIAKHQGRHLEPGDVRHGEEAGLDHHQHEERLEAHLRVRIGAAAVLPLNGAHSRKGHTPHDVPALVCRNGQQRFYEDRDERVAGTSYLYLQPCNLM